MEVMSNTSNPMEGIIRFGIDGQNVVEGHLLCIGLIF